MHAPRCSNCGRQSTLPATLHTELTEVDARCEHGAVPHEHPDEEKIARIDAFFERQDAPRNLSTP